jgi:hypothetical protein
VAVGGNGAICASPDGTNWSREISPVSDELWGVAGGKGQFVAVGDYGDIVTSPDGTNWMEQTSPISESDLTLYNVSYGNGHFVAVGDSGTLLLSTDATNWIADDPGVDGELDAVTYYENGSFVIAGAGGVLLLNLPPRLSLLPTSSNHTLQFRLNGLNGSTAIIEATPTLAPANWQPIATNVVDHGVVTITDEATNRSLYYRARIQ